MEIFQIRYFLAVADHLNFTRAAEALHISQPPLSLQISKLEQELGGRLFTRSSRHVSLTEFGRFFEPRARLLVKAADDLAREAKSRTALPCGRLRVGASGVLAHLILPSVLSKFAIDHPQIELHVDEGRTPQLISKMEQNQLDIALVRAPHRPTQLLAETIARQPLCVVLSRSHPLASARSLQLEQIRDESLIFIAEANEPYYDLILELCRRRGFYPKVSCAGVDYTAASALVRHGSGVTILSQMAEMTVMDPSLVFVPIDDAMAVSPIVLLTRDEADINNVANAFAMIARAHSDEASYTTYSH